MCNENLERRYYHYIYKIIFLKGSPENRYYYGKRSFYGISIEDDKYTGSGNFCFAYFKKYGTIEGETYIKEIIEENPDIDTNRDRENFWIGDLWKTDPLCMNQCPGGKGCAEHDTLCYVQDKYKKDISQYDLYGNFIKTWHGIRDACRELNINRTGVSACLKGRKPTAFGYMWKYSDNTENPIEPYYRITPVVQYNREGKQISEFNSPIEAEHKTGINSGSIRSCCNGERPSAGNYIWRFKNDAFDKYRTNLIDPKDKNRIYTKKIRPILQFTKNGEFVKEYSCINDAMKALNKDGNGSMIYAVANGSPKRKSAYGYIWKFKENV